MNDAQTGCTGNWHDLTKDFTFVVGDVPATDDLTSGELAEIRRRYQQADTPLKRSALLILRNRIGPDAE